MKLLITHLQERIQYLEGFETKSSQLEQQYRTLRQDYLVAQAAADYYKRMVCLLCPQPRSYCAICIAWRVFGEWRQGVRRALQRRGEEAKKARGHHQQTGEHLEVSPTGPSHNHSQLWNFTSQLQLSASEHGQGQRDLYDLTWTRSKSLVLNTIRRLKIQCEDMKQSRHYSTSSSIAIPGRDSECSGNYYSGSSFGMSSGSMGSYYHVHPLSCFLCSTRHEIRLVPLFTLIVVATQIYREMIIRFLMNGRVFPPPSSTIWALNVWRKPKYLSL